MPKYGLVNALRSGSRLLVALVLGAATFAAQGATCFAVDDDTARIVVFDRDPPVNLRYNAVIPGFGSERIEAAYFDAVQNRYYVVDQIGGTGANTVGFIDPFDGSYNLVGTNLGSVGGVQAGNGNGAQRIIGLTRNPLTNRWYVLRIDGYMFELNITTGAVIPTAFGGVGYLRVRNPAGALATDFEDFAFDSTGRLHAVKNDPGAEQMLVDIDLVTGYAAKTVNTGLNEAEGLALTNGELRLIIGASGGTNARNFYRVDPDTGATQLIFNLPSPSATAADYEAAGCNDSFLRADLELTKTATPASVLPGGTVTYTIGVLHRGIDQAYRIQIRDTLDPGLSFVSYAFAGCGVCSFDTATGIWTIDMMDIAQRRTLTLVVSTAGAPANQVAYNRVQVVQQCESASGPCVPLADFDSTPNNKSGAWTPTEDDEAIAGVLVTAAPSVNKTFTPVSGVAGATTTLRLTISNPNTTQALTVTAAFTDTYPAGMTNYTTPAAATSCIGATASATAGGSSLSLGTFTMAANSSCTATVVVRANVVGFYDNTIPAGALSTTQGPNLVAVTGTYRVTPVNLGVLKDFAPTAMGANATSTLRITFSNPTAVTANFTADFTDTYPAGLVNHTTPAAATSCGGTGGPTAAAGGNTVGLPTTRFIPASSSCTLTVVVTASARGDYTNTIPAAGVSTSVGSNLGPATAVLEVGNPLVSKVFNPAAIAAAGISTLTITFANPLSVTATFTGVFTDTYPAGVVNAATPAAASTCGSAVVTAVAGANTVSLAAGATIAPLSQCTLRVQVTGSTATTTGTFVNTIPAGAVSTTSGTNTVAASATLVINTLTDLRVTKVANRTSGTPTTTISYTVTFSNAGPAAANTATFSDVFNGIGLVSAVTATPAGGATVVQIATTTTSIAGTLTLPLNATVTLAFQATPTLYGGYVTNTAAISPRPGTTDANLTNNTASVAVFISPTANLQVSKTDGATTVAAGSTTTYTLTFVNGGLSAADGAVVRDIPSAGLSCTLVSCASTGGASCTGLTTGALLGGHPLASFPANSTVTVLVACAVTASGS